MSQFLQGGERVGDGQIAGGGPAVVEKGSTPTTCSSGRLRLPGEPRKVGQMRFRFPCRRERGYTKLFRAKFERRRLPRSVDGFRIRGRLKDAGKLVEDFAGAV